MAPRAEERNHPALSPKDKKGVLRILHRSLCTQTWMVDPHAKCRSRGKGLERLSHLQNALASPRSLYDSANKNYTQDSPPWPEGRQ